MDGADDKNGSLVGKSNEKKKDMSKVRCFACHKTGHYASQCLNKKKKKQETEVLASTKIVEFAEKYEEFSLMTCPVGSDCLEDFRGTKGCQPLSVCDLLLGTIFKVFQAVLSHCFRTINLLSKTVNS
jgi:hypothetical protein